MRERRGRTAGSAGFRSLAAPFSSSPLSSLLHLPSPSSSQPALPPLSPMLHHGPPYLLTLHTCADDGEVFLGGALLRSFPPAARDSCCCCLLTISSTPDNVFPGPARCLPLGLCYRPNPSALRLRPARALQAAPGAACSRDLRTAA